MHERVIGTQLVPRRQSYWKYEIDLDEGSSTTAPLRGDEMTAQPLLNPISIGLCNARRTTHVIEKFTTEPSPCAVATVAVDTSISVHDTRTIGRTP